ncbi:hypothetical protein BDQ12DRAFT_711652 [Crucibulum laeve]|uniref:ThuA-like domain-containing protein n=1 Tax=Crucibulum laeve TaxID=68775 RepID=A0A5C3M6I3_9AGAR|nr:hypothetical protein BDQ12DRAFT_711652 [Crucibulum laeve]
MTVLFLSTTREGCSPRFFGEICFPEIFQPGRNFIGVYSATDYLRNDTFYEGNSALFDCYEDLQTAICSTDYDHDNQLSFLDYRVADASHPSTSKLPPAWRVQDEMCNFDSDPSQPLYLLQTSRPTLHHSRLERTMVHEIQPGYTLSHRNVEGRQYSYCMSSEIECHSNWELKCTPGKCQPNCFGIAFCFFTFILGHIYGNHLDQQLLHLEL